MENGESPMVPRRQPTDMWQADGDIPPTRLADIDFTDLFISESGDVFMRGSDSDETLPITGVPESVMGELDTLQKQVCARGQREIEFFVDYNDMRFRVSRIDGLGGIWYTLRRAKWPIPSLAELGGIPAPVINQLALLGRRGSHGLILISGATSQGKTTTACSLLREYLVFYGDVAITVEDPPELPLDGPHGKAGHCFQTQVQNGDFATAMKLTMRRAPRYILLGEVRSPGEASQALRAAINGHLVLTTIHAGSCIEAINALLKFVAGEENMDLARTILADGLAAVFHQQLVKIKGRRGRRLKVEYLFPGQNKGIRTMIRQGKTEQLSTAIALQAQRVQNGQLPLEE